MRLGLTINLFRLFTLEACQRAAYSSASRPVLGKCQKKYLNTRLSLPTLLEHRLRLKKENKRKLNLKFIRGFYINIHTKTNKKL